MRKTTRKEVKVKANVVNSSSSGACGGGGGGGGIGSSGINLASLESFFSKLIGKSRDASAFASLTIRKKSLHRLNKVFSNSSSSSSSSSSAAATMLDAATKAPSSPSASRLFRQLRGASKHHTSHGSKSEAIKRHRHVVEVTPVPCVTPPPPTEAVETSPCCEPNVNVQSEDIASSPTTNAVNDDVHETTSEFVHSLLAKLNDVNLVTETVANCADAGDPNSSTSSKQQQHQQHTSILKLLLESYARHVGHLTPESHVEANQTPPDESQADSDAGAVDNGDNNDDDESNQTFLVHKEDDEEDEASAENDDATADNSHENGDDDHTESTSTHSTLNSRIQETTFLKALLESFPDALRAFQEAFDKGDAVCDADDEDTNDSNDDRSSPGSQSADNHQDHHDSSIYEDKVALASATATAESDTSSSSVIIHDDDDENCDNKNSSEP